MEGYKRKGRQEMIELNMKDREWQEKKAEGHRENKKGDNGVHEKGRGETTKEPLRRHTKNSHLLRWIGCVISIGDIVEE